MNEEFYYKYIVKNIDIGLVGVYTLIIGIILCLSIEHLFPKFSDDYKKKHILIIILDIFLTTALLICCAKFIRKYVVTIPFYYDNDPKYKPYSYLKMQGNVLLAFSLISFSPSYRKKIEYVLSKLKLFKLKHTLNI